MGIEVSAFIECIDCRHQWEVPFEWDGSTWRAQREDLVERCPLCRSTKVRNVSSEQDGDML